MSVPEFESITGSSSVIMVARQWHTVVEGKRVDGDVANLGASKVELTRS